MRNQPYKVGNLNTWYIEIPGMISYDGKIVPSIIGVHFTSDDHESMSLEALGLQITVNFDNLREIFRIARKHNEQRKNRGNSNGVA